MCCSPTVFLGRYLRFTMTIEGILTNIFGIITIHSMNPFEPCKFHTWHAQLNSPRCPVAIQKWLPPRFSMDQATLFVQFRNKEVHGPSRLQDTRLQAFIKGCQTSCPATSSNAVGQVFTTVRKKSLEEGSVLAVSFSSAKVFETRHSPSHLGKEFTLKKVKSGWHTSWPPPRRWACQLEMKGQLDRYIPCRVCAGMGSWMGPPHRVAWWDRLMADVLRCLNEQRKFWIMKPWSCNLSLWSDGKLRLNPRRHPQRLGWTQFLNGISWRFLIHSTSSFWIREVAETKGIWPRLNGWVRSLAKVTNAERVGHYHPITVMPFAY